MSLLSYVDQLRDQSLYQFYTRQYPEGTSNKDFAEAHWKELEDNWDDYVGLNLSIEFELLRDLFCTHDMRHSYEFDILSTISDMYWSDQPSSLDVAQTYRWFAIEQFYVVTHLSRLWKRAAELLASE